MLTRRELEVAEYVAWGATQKEIANTLFIDNDTVANHLKNIYRKLQISKATELSAWYFCQQYHIPTTLSPLKRKISVMLLLLLLIPTEIITASNTMVRTPATRTVSARPTRTKRNELNIYDHDNTEFDN